MAYNQYDLANTSLVKTGNLTEMYVPLWWYSSGIGYNNNNASFVLVEKGSASSGSTSSVPSASKLHALNTNWSTAQQFALEVSVYSTGGTASVQLFDVTSGTATAVSGSLITTTSSSYIVLRSGKFSLTPGHSYAVGVMSSSTSYYSYLSKASLIAFLS